MSKMATLTPCAASARAVAAPRPEAPPVTTAAMDDIELHGFPWVDDEMSFEDRLAPRGRGEKRHARVNGRQMLHATPRPARNSSRRRMCWTGRCASAPRGVVRAAGRTAGACRWSARTGPRPRQAGMPGHQSSGASASATRDQVEAEHRLRRGRAQPPGRGLHPGQGVVLEVLHRVDGVVAQGPEHAAQRHSAGPGQRRPIDRQVEARHSRRPAPGVIRLTEDGPPPRRGEPQQDAPVEGQAEPGLRPPGDPLHERIGRHQDQRGDAQQTG